MTLRTLFVLAGGCALLACGRERITVGYTSGSRSTEAWGSGRGGATVALAGGGAEAAEAGRTAADSGGRGAAGCSPECAAAASCGTSCGATGRVDAGSSAGGSCPDGFREEVTSDVTGDSQDPVPLQYAPVIYFAGGEPLPAGRYRVEYVDGCFSCCITLADVFFLVRGDSAMQFAVLPGGEAAGLDVPPVAHCPVTGGPFAPLDFDFEGGSLGIWLSDGISADNVNGDGAGGHSPTWRLTRLDGC